MKDDLMEVIIVEEIGLIAEEIWPMEEKVDHMEEEICLMEEVESTIRFGGGFGPHEGYVGHSGDYRYEGYGYHAAA